MHRQDTGTRSTLRRATRMAAALAGASLVLATMVTAEHRENGRWVGTWSASPQAAASPVQINGQTLRQVVRTSVGGERCTRPVFERLRHQRRGHRLSARRRQRRRWLRFSSDPIERSRSMVRPPLPFPRERWWSATS